MRPHGPQFFPDPASCVAVKLSSDNLAAALTRGLAPIYLVCGDETLLVNEAADAIRTRARAAGFSERELHTVERGFDWDALLADSRELSLFAQRKLIEIRMPTAAPGDAGSQAIVELATKGSPDNLVLIVTGKPDARAQAPRWIASIEQHGALVQVYPIELARLGAWIRERLARHQLRADNAAIALLVERVEGNLLAAHQEIEKLALLLPPGELSAEQVLEGVADSARFDVLQLGEAAMRGQAGRALRILGGLQAEAIEPTLALWGVNKDLQWIARAQYLMRRGQSADSAMNAIWVWRARQPAMKLALARLKRPQVRTMLLTAERVDRSIKGQLDADPWLELEALVANLAGAWPRAA